MAMMRAVASSHRLALRRNKVRVCRVIQLGRSSTACTSAAATPSMAVANYFSSSDPPSAASASKLPGTADDDPSSSSSTAGDSGDYQTSDRDELRRGSRGTSSSTSGSTAFPWKSSSTSRAAQPTTSPSSAPHLPVRHSRHKLPLVCADRAQLHDLTSQVLESKALFAYRDGKNTRDDAWDAASEVVQKVEFLMRGHARLLPGTQWNRWLPPKGSNEGEVEVDPAPTIAVMQSLVDRLWEEGHTYMTVRSGRMEELHGPKTSASPSPFHDDKESRTALSPSPSSLLRDNYSISSDADDDDDQSSDGSSSSSDEEDNGSDFDFRGAQDLANFFGDGSVEDSVGASLDDEGEGESYLNDFSLPGPTTHMYDVVLDSIACHPTEPRQGFFLLQHVLGRHGLDGGDERNSSEYTRPTVLSYNAPIRLAANLPYDGSSSSSSAELRDEALQLALGAFDALGHSAIVQRNSATYSYLLQVIAKYLRTGETRGNIALGIFHHARVHGLIDDAVLDAFRAAHTPSNGRDFERWILKHLGSTNRPAKELPHRWRRQGRARRHHPRESTY